MKNNAKNNAMQIGQAAARAGVNIRTLHYYERRGLLKPDRTTSANYRIYSEELIQRVRFIKSAQELGFTLEEIKELLELRVDADATAADVRERADAKIANIKEKIRTLQAIQESLERLTAACCGAGPTVDCPILETLNEGTLT